MPKGLLIMNLHLYENEYGIEIIVKKLINFYKKDYE